MSRPKQSPCYPLTVRIPAELHGKIADRLYSEALGKIPFGSWQAFISKLLRDYLDAETLDLGPYLSTPEGVYTVKGHPEVIKALRNFIIGE